MKLYKELHTQLTEVFKEDSRSFEQQRTEALDIGYRSLRGQRGKDFRTQRSVEEIDSQKRRRARREEMNSQNPKNLNAKEERPSKRLESDRNKGLEIVDGVEKRELASWDFLCLVGAFRTRAIRIEATTGCWHDGGGVDALLSASISCAGRVLIPHGWQDGEAGCVVTGMGVFM